MKLCFSTKNVDMPSFLQLCRFAYDYGYGGFELYDAFALRKKHSDSLLIPDHRSDASRKLRNRGLEVPALTFPGPLDECAPEDLARYVEIARAAGVRLVILRPEKEADAAALKDKSIFFLLSFFFRLIILLSIIQGFECLCLYILGNIILFSDLLRGW